MGYNADKNIQYHPFPNPQTDSDKCNIWIKACNRTHDILNVDKISADCKKGKNSRSYFICSDHFVEGEPTADYPYPYSADPLSLAGGAATAGRKQCDKKPATKRKRSPSRDAEQSKRPCVIRTEAPQPQHTPVYDDPPPMPPMPVREATPTIVQVVRCYSRTFPYDTQPSTSHAAHPSAEDQEAAIPAYQQDQQHPMDTCQHVCLTCPNCSDIFTLSKEQVCHLQKAAFLQQSLASDKTVMHFFGFPSINMLRGTFDWLLPSAEKIRLWKGKQTMTDDFSNQKKRSKLTLFDEYLLTFLKLRQNYDIKLLSILFGISPAYAARIFYSWICFLDTAFAKPLLQYPSNVPAVYHVYSVVVHFVRFAPVLPAPAQITKNLCDFRKGLCIYDLNNVRDLLSNFGILPQETVAENLPSSFKAFPTTRVIIDCFELKLEKPARPVAQRQTW